VVGGSRRIELVESIDARHMVYQGDLIKLRLSASSPTYQVSLQQGDVIQCGHFYTDREVVEEAGSVHDIYVSQSRAGIVQTDSDPINLMLLNGTLPTKGLRNGSRILLTWYANGVLVSEETQVVITDSGVFAVRPSSAADFAVVHVKQFVDVALDASSNAMKDSLMTLGTVGGSVSVFRVGSGVDNSYRWTIGFTGLNSRLNCPLVPCIAADVVLPANLSLPLPTEEISDTWTASVHVADPGSS